MNNKIKLRYDSGTIIVSEIDKAFAENFSGEWDERIDSWRFPGYVYKDIFTELYKNNSPFEDLARDYQEIDTTVRFSIEPFPYQKAALQAWLKAGKCGVITLPTGSGKSYLANLAIEKARRSTLVVVPTIDLMNQWYEILSSTFTQDVGLIGGGYYEVKPITVTTYDSAYLYMERFGNKFGFVIFDECHHLPGETYILAAKFCLAPYRMGLTATLERADGKEELLTDVIGKVIYRKEIDELSGKYLSDYETITLSVPLSAEQWNEYQEHRQIYLNFIRYKQINMGSPNGWSRFIIESSRSDMGRKAFRAYRKQKELSQGAANKLDVLEKLLHQHRNDRVIIFTEDNNTVFKISRRFLIPSITHKTKTKERKEILEKFNNGQLNIITTSKVLNEGINVPEANIAIILSGNSSVREHVQRLGRILRRQEKKHAILYELIAERTSEESVSQRRREHRAYQ